MCSSFKRTSRTRDVRMAGAVKGGRPSPEPSFTSLQQTLTARPWSAHQAREQSLSVGECDRVVDITPLTVWPLTFMLAHKAVPHGCRHLLFTSMCSTIPTSPDSGLTSRCSWTAKANPPPSCFIAGQAAGHIYMLVVATGPNYVLVVWSTDGCITEALKAVV
jgi:hypothetical protein